MNTVTNTAKNPRIDWLFGGNPNAIEAQEAQGQKELVNSSQLPIKNNTWRSDDKDAKSQYEKMGIKVIDKSNGDEIFYDVIMPDGWEKEATDHSMWNRLVDNKGRVRANFFYKAAFYDRSSHINFTTRYQLKDEYFEGEKNPENSWDVARKYHAIDSATGAILFSTYKHFSDGQDSAAKEAKDFLTENYPQWEDVNAYWD